MHVDLLADEPESPPKHNVYPDPERDPDDINDHLHGAATAGM